MHFACPGGSAENRSRSTAAFLRQAISPCAVNSGSVMAGRSAPHEVPKEGYEDGKKAGERHIAAAHHSARQDRPLGRQPILPGRYPSLQRLKNWLRKHLHAPHAISSTGCRIVINVMIRRLAFVCYRVASVGLRGRTMHAAHFACWAVHSLLSRRGHARSATLGHWLTHGQKLAGQTRLSHGTHIPPTHAPNVCSAPMAGIER